VGTILTLQTRFCSVVGSVPLSAGGSRADVEAVGPELRGGAVERGLVAPVEHDPRSCLRQPACHRQPQAADGTGDERGTPVE
jgi:hypothetical protein